MSRRLFGIRTKLSMATMAIGATFLLGAECGTPHPPLAGRSEYRAMTEVRTPGGIVDVAGGNLLVPREDLDIDTRLGNLAVGATWNSASRAWQWSFDMTYNGTTFTDDTGAVHTIDNLPNGSAIPGTSWVKLSSQEIKTKGGRVYEFNANGKLRFHRWTSSVFPRMEYTTEVFGGAPRVTRIDQCGGDAASTCNLVVSMSYSTSGKISSITDRAGRQAYFTYDAAGNLATARDALDLANSWPGWRYEYGVNPVRLTARVSSEGERVEYGYTGAAAPYDQMRISSVRQIGGSNPTFAFEYRQPSNVLWATMVADPTGKYWTFKIDQDRRLQSFTTPAGDMTQWTWSGKRPVSRTTAAGVVTSWTYTGDDIATQTEPTGRVITVTYAPSGVDRENPLSRPVLTASDGLGTLFARTYDGAGRLTSIRNGENETITFAYNNETENVRLVTNPDGSRLELSAYGAHGHPTTAEFAGIVDTRLYDEVGNLRKGFDLSIPDGAALGGVVGREFDLDRNVVKLNVQSLDATSDLTQMTAGPLRSIDMKWRSDHQRKEITRPYGGDTQFVYDALGRLVKRREYAGGWSETIFEYDAAGRRRATVRPNGMRTEWTLDDAGRHVGITHKRSGVVETSLTRTFVNGRITSETDSSYGGGAETYTYDNGGRVSRTVFPNGESIDRAWDYRARPVLTTYKRSDGTTLRTIERAWDGVNRPTEVWDGSTKILDATYEDGHLAEEWFGNGLTRTYAYGADHGLLVGSGLENGAGQSVEATTVDRSFCSLWGVMTRCVIADTDTTGGVSSREIYQLSAAEDERGSRLARWARNTTMNPGTALSYSYDELSNLTEIHDGSGRDRFIYNAEHNRMLEVRRGTTTVASYTYDAAGFVTSRDGVPVTWTAAGRVASIGSGKSFEWDASGRPIRVTSPAENVHFRYGGEIETDAAGTAKRLDLGFAELRLDAAERLYRHLDFRNNVKVVTNQAGAVVTHYRYNGFDLDVVNGSSSADTQRFAIGRDLSDVVLLGARVYDPFIGRFLSADPIYSIFDQHAYTIGNPVYFWDPGGERVEITTKISVNVGVTKGITGVGITVGGEWTKSVSFDPGDLDGTNETTECPGGPDSGEGEGDGSGDGNGNGEGDGDGSGDGNGDGSGDGSGDGQGGGDGGGGGPGPGPGPSPGPTCSPTLAPEALPHLRTALAVLAPLQIGLGFWLIRQRRKSRADRKAGNE
jgi:RHS repeat-associated protein